MILALTGFMGCGKSSVGRLVASRLGCAFTDLDEAVEAAQGRSVARIFAEDGEAAFRTAELEALKDILSTSAPGTTVLALGGGTLTTPEARQLVAERAKCIYLRATIDTLTQNLMLVGTESRPMLKGADGEASLRRRIEALMAERSSIYEEAADVIIDIDGLSTSEIADKIIAL